MKQIHIIKIIIFFIVLILIYSCSEKKKQLFDESDNNKYNLWLQTYGCVMDYRTTASFNFKINDTLTVFKSYCDYTDSSKIIKTRLQKIDQDSLYSYFKDAISNFNLKEQNQNIGQQGDVIKLAIFSKANSITIGYSSIESLKKNNSDVAQLINFLNRKLDINDRIDW